MDSQFNYRAEQDRYIDDEYWYGKFINLKK